MPFTAGQKLRASNLGALSHCAQYTGAANQTINTGAATTVAFGTADITSTYVTRAANGAGHQFTLNASGLWSIAVTTRWSTTGASATGEKSLDIETGAGAWYHSSVLPASTTVPVTNHVSFTTWLASGTILVAQVFQNSGGGEDLQGGGAENAPRINLALILKDD